MLEFPLTTPFPVWNGERYEWYFLAATSQCDDGRTSGGFDPEVKLNGGVLGYKNPEINLPHIHFDYGDFFKTVVASMAVCLNGHAGRAGSFPHTAQFSALYENCQRDALIEAMATFRTPYYPGLACCLYRWEATEGEWSVRPFFPGSSPDPISLPIGGTVRGSISHLSGMKTDLLDAHPMPPPVACAYCMDSTRIDPESYRVAVAMQDLGINMFQKGRWYHSSTGVEAYSFQNTNSVEFWDPRARAHTLYALSCSRKAHQDGFLYALADGKLPVGGLSFADFDPWMTVDSGGQYIYRSFFSNLQGDRWALQELHENSYKPNKRPPGLSDSNIGFPSLFLAMAKMIAYVSSRFGEWSYDYKSRHLEAYQQHLFWRDRLLRNAAHLILRNPRLTRPGRFVCNSRCGGVIDVISNEYSQDAGADMTFRLSDSQVRHIAMAFLEGRSYDTVEGTRRVDIEGDYNSIHEIRIPRREFSWAFFPNPHSPNCATPPGFFSALVGPKQTYPTGVWGDRAQWWWRSACLHLGSGMGYQFGALKKMPSPGVQTSKGSPPVIRGGKGLTRSIRIRQRHRDALVQEAKLLKDRQKGPRYARAFLNEQPVRPVPLP